MNIPFVDIELALCYCLRTTYFSIVSNNLFSFFHRMWQKVDEPLAQRFHSSNQWNEKVHHESNGDHQSDSSVDYERHRFKNNVSVVDSHGTLVVHQDVEHKDEVSMQVDTESRFEDSKSDRMVKALPSVLPPVDNAGCSQFSSPSTTSLSASRQVKKDVIHPYW